MKIAIPIFGTRVSPRFDYAREFLLSKAANGMVIEREELSSDGLTALARVRMILELGVDILICGGIDRISSQQLSFSDIRIYSWVTGESEDALNCFLRGELEPGIMLDSNGRRRGRWRFKGEPPRPDGHWGRGKGRGKGRGQGKGTGRGLSRY